MVLQGEFAKPFGIVKFSREATNFAAGKIASTFERASGAQRASPRSSLVSSSRAVAHSCRRDQPARIQRIPVRRCRRPACAVADASETMPPKNSVLRVPYTTPPAFGHLPLHRGGLEKRPLPALMRHQRGPAGPFSLETVHWTVSRVLEPPKGEGKAGVATPLTSPKTRNTPYTLPRGRLWRWSPRERACSTRARRSR